MNTKNNKRGRDTDEKIVRAMFRVMTRENKALSRVTVREICQEAGINRSSFYAHYQDVFEVMERVEATMAKGLTEAFVEKLDHGSGIGECFEAMFAYIGENRGFYSFYFTETNRTGVIGVAWELLQDRLQRLNYREFGFQTEEEMQYHGEFFLFGMCGVDGLEGIRLEACVKRLGCDCHGGWGEVLHLFEMEVEFLSKCCEFCHVHLLTGGVRGNEIGYKLLIEMVFGIHSV